MVVMKMSKKSNHFEVHMNKIEKINGTIIIVCNYYFKEFKWSIFEGYYTYQHVNNFYPTKVMKSKAEWQTQIAKYASPKT